MDLQLMASPDGTTVAITLKDDHEIWLFGTKKMTTREDHQSLAEQLRLNFSMRDLLVFAVVGSAKCWDS